MCSPTSMSCVNGCTISSAAGVDAGCSAGVGRKVSDLSLKKSISVSHLISRFQDIADQNAEDSSVRVCVCVCVCVILVSNGRSPLYVDFT